MEGYVEPSVNAAAFHCPHCQSYSDQYWIPLRVGISHGNVTNMPHYTVGFCNHCRDTTIWKDTFMIYPSTGGAPPPNPDMSELIKKDYNEARDVATRSPRSACMLLRLCVQKICDERVPGRYDLNAKIGKLVEQGLDDDIRKACDSVRVIGGEAAHPLQLNLTDDKDTAAALFRIVNHISHWAHTRKKEIDEIYKLMPESKIDAMAARDAKP